ncbi:diaminopimelate epimerase (plasmid) [Legionella adelaidensis]|uniref:Diaminopimelate epimerase n=1 Tax=Legionella adelaidensis TaxID=45056 RepID=A0A0W0R2B6_9GAMM|nr:diaminopimelate epimerase [Legionella adelaidensis]KTC65248.1 diaminopimelate epimerase [Legionella adelaidensis]VEH86226.1 diaminopimelate epimerase [Legionella adelaidensis]
MKITFTKMHGLGNDFIVLDTIRQKINLAQLDIKYLSDRHTGIGFDQCLIIEPSEDPAIDFLYKIYNSDGKEVGQCGNGARCLARYVAHYQLSQKKIITVATKTTRMELQINKDDTVTVDMGLPKLHPVDIPFLNDTQQKTYTVPSLNGENFAMYLINVGNPHAVLLVPQVEEAKVQEIGSYICHHPLFPEQVNVGFMEVINPQHVKLRVFERGCGETMACGSGAVAAAALGRLYLNLDSTITVSLPGGDLQIHWESPHSPIYLTGPATFVYQGFLL